MSLQEYAPNHFNDLPTFRQAQENLKQLQPKLDKIGRVLHKHGCADEIGIALLHRHFDLADDEVLVEKVEPAQGQSVGAPRNRDTSGKILPHLFRAVVSDNDSACVWFPVEFADVEDDDGSLAERYARFQANAPLLNDVAQTLRDEGAIGAIGLSLFHGREEINCSSNEILVESTDDVRRVLVMRPGSIGVDDKTSTPTLWRFDGKKVLMACTCQNSPQGHNHYESN